MNRVDTAAALATAFIGKQRDNGETFYCLRDGSPEWMIDAVHVAHDGKMPNDTSYSMIRDAAINLAETLAADDYADLAEAVDTLSDTLIPAYTSERLAWLSSHLDRVAYVDEAIKEFGFPANDGIVQAIAYGIQAELHMIGSALVSAIEAQADEGEEV